MSDEREDKSEQAQTQDAAAPDHKEEQTLQRLRRSGRRKSSPPRPREVRRARKFVVLPRASAAA